jgi:hypothetical protein
VPPPSPPRTITTGADDFVSAISVDTDFYWRFYENSAVKKTLTIPAWLNQQRTQRKEKSIYSFFSSRSLRFFF